MASYGSDTLYGGMLNEVIVAMKSPPIGYQDSSSFDSLFGASVLAWETNSVLTGSNMEFAASLGIDISSDAKYLKFIERVGIGATILEGAMTGLDAYNNGLEAHHVADLGIQAGLYYGFASVPVAGWALGTAYFLGNMYFESTHNGESITEYYLDTP